MSGARGALPAVVLLLASVAAFALLTWPLATRPAEAVLSHWDADIEHSLWVQWWFATAIESGEHTLFRTDMIRFPQVVDLHLADLNLAVNASTYLLGLALDAALAYNAALLLGFALSGWSMQRLVLRLGGSAGAAPLAGLVFAASPYWLASALNGWGYLVHVWVLPIGFLALLRARDHPGLASCVWLGVVGALIFHVTPYYFVYTLVSFALLSPWHMAACREWLRRPGARPGALVFAAVAAVGIGPRALGMLAASSADLVVHHGPLNAALGAPLSELFWPSSAAVAERLPRLGYLVPFLGFTLIAGVSAAFALGPDRRSQRPWLVSAGVMLVLALGPELRLSQWLTTGLPLPARWLQQLPVFELTTNHWRWVLPAGFCLSVAFGLGLTSLMRRFGAREVGVGVLLAFVLEALLLWPFPWRKPLWEVRPSPIAFSLRDRDAPGAVLDRTRHRKLNQTVHGKPIALGWLPRIDVATERADEQMLSTCRGEPPECLRRYGIGVIVRDDETALLLLDGGTQILRSR